MARLVHRQPLCSRLITDSGTGWASPSTARTHPRPAARPYDDATPADKPMASDRNFVSDAVTQRWSQPMAGGPNQLCGQIELEVGGWWATLDSNQ